MRKASRHRFSAALSPDTSEIPASDEDTSLLRARQRVPTDVSRPRPPTVTLRGEASGGEIRR